MSAAFWQRLLDTVTNVKAATQPKVARTSSGAQGYMFTEPVIMKSSILHPRAATQKALLYKGMT